VSRRRAVSALSALLAAVAVALPATAQAQLPEPPPAPDVPELPALPTVGDIGELVEELLGQNPPPEEVVERLRFTWETSYGADGAGDPVVRTHEGVLLVPTPLDVDGNPGPEVTAQLQIDAGRATIRVQKLPSAPAELPLQVEAVLPDPRGGEGDLFAAFGYDTRSDTAPEVYDATLALVGAGRSATFTLDTRVVGPGERLAVIGSLFERGENGERVDPVRGRFEFDPVPLVAHVGVLLGSDLGLTRSGVELATETPTKATVKLEDLRGTSSVTLDGVIDKVPNSLSLMLTDAESGQRTLNYTATDVVERISARVADRQDGNVRQDFQLELGDMPRTVQLVQDSPTHLRMEASEPIGSLEVASATGGEARKLETPAYVHAYDRDGVDSIAARVLGLQRAELDTGDPLVVDATMQAGPFDVLLVDGERTLDGKVRDLPSQVRVELSPQDGTLDYTGSSPIGELTLDGSDPSGFQGRATDLHLLAREIPTSLGLTYGDAGDQVSLDAGGGQVGLLEVQLTSGPDERLDPAVDGILLHDLADRYVLFGRVTNLRRVAVTQEPTPDLTLDTAGGRVFRVDYDKRLDSGKVMSIDAKIDKLQPATRLRLIDDAQGKRVTYDAAAATDEITIDGKNVEGLSGRAEEIHVLMRGIPPSLVVGLDDGTGRVNINAGGRELGLLEAQLTSGPDDRIASGFDGILLKDVADRYVLFARITGLRSATAVQTPAPDLTLDATGNRVFKVDINQQPLSGGKTTFTRATLDRLQRSTRVRVVPTSVGQRIEYTAASRTNSLSFESNSGNRWNLSATAAPLPASLVLCQASNNTCGGSGRTSNAGSVSLNASEHTTINLFDCVRPATSACPGDPDEFIRVTNLRVRRLVEDAHSENSGERGHIYLDTDNHELTGSILARDGSGGFEANFPSGFRSNDRLGRWTLFGLSKDKSGSINCPGGTSLAVYVIGIRIGVTSYLC
jgi:hypothetical protein